MPWEDVSSITDTVTKFQLAKLTGHLDLLALIANHVWTVLILFKFKVT